MHRVVHGVRHTVDDVIWRGDEGEEGAIGGGGRTNDSRAEGGVEELEERGGAAARRNNAKLKQMGKSQIKYRGAVLSLYLRSYSEQKPLGVHLRHHRGWQCRTFFHYQEKGPEGSDAVQPILLGGCTVASTAYFGVAPSLPPRTLGFHRRYHRVIVASTVTTTA